MKLNLGCGADIRHGYINVDFGDRQGYVDTDTTGFQSADLTKFPWPWTSNSVDEILMWHVLEHLPDTARTIAEVHSILKPGGRFWGQVPFCFSELSFAQFDHLHHFHWLTFHGMEHFGFEVTTEPVSFSLRWSHKLRNLVPGRRLWSRLFLNMYDAVNFSMVKTGNGPAK
jgi:predicted SAM-dependent methyltransferase